MLRKNYDAQFILKKEIVWCQRAPWERKLFYPSPDPPTPLLLTMVWCQVPSVMGRSENDVEVRECCFV